MAPTFDRAAAAAVLGEAQLLERIARGDPLGELLSDLARLIEGQGGGAIASILVLDREAGRLRHAAAPSLPAGFVEAVDDLEIGPAAGSCGTAAYQGEPVVVRDIASDPRWDRYRAAALAHGLAACWSTPIVSSRDEVLGTFAIYYRQPRAPAPAHVRLLGVATHLAAIAIERSEAIDELARSRDFYLTLLEDFPAMVWRTDAAGHCDYVNGTWTEFTGLGLTRSLGDGWVAAVHPDDRERTLAAIGAALAGRTPFAVEHRLAHHAGGHRWVESVGRPLRSLDGDFTGLIGACQDIEDRRRAQEAIGRQTALLENSNDAIGIADLEGRVVYLNRSACRLVGLDEERAPDVHVEDLFMPESWATVRNRAIPLVHGRGEWRGEGRLRHAVTGEPVPVEMSVFLIRDDETGEPAWIGTIQRDISERRAARAAEARLAAIVQSSVDAVVSADPDGTITSWNPAAQALFGWSAGEAVGRHVSLLLPGPEHVGEQQTIIRRARLGHVVRNLETTRRTKDGRRLPVSVTVAPVRDAEGEVTAFAAILHDISDRELLEREQRIARHLQRSLLPQIPEAVQGAQLAARYLPAGVGTGIDVGGDWYDAIELPDGRLAVVIGDVVGRGTRAAATMGELRSVVRAYALVGGGPADVLARLDRYAATRGDRVLSLFATVWYGELDLATGDLRYASAGHLPALVVEPGGATRLLEGGGGLPVGVAVDAPYVDAATALAPGAMLLLYTDGLVERRDASIDVGIARLREVACGAADPGRLLDVLVDEVVGPEEAHDDTAMLVVRLAPGAASAAGAPAPGRA